MRWGLSVWVLAAVSAMHGQGSDELARAISLEQNGQTDQAIAVLQAILKRDPRSAEAHNWLGVAYLQKNSLSEAADEFRQAVKLKPGFVRAYNNLGSTLAQAGDIAQGIQALQEGLKYAPDDLQLRLNLGMALRSKGDADSALEHFRSLLQKHSDSPELHYQYGQTLRQKGDLDGAIQALEESLDLDPELQEGYYALGLALKQFGARAKRSTAATGAPELLKKGTEALARNDFTVAREAAEQAVSKEPGSAEAHYLLGFALWYGGDRPAAASAIDASLRLNPAAADVYSFRGMTYRETGDLSRARRMLQRAIALDPQRPVAYLDLAVVFLRQGNLDRAIGQFEAGLNLPAAQRGLPDLDTAIRELRDAIGRQSPRGDAYRALGRLLGAAGANATDVLAAFQEALKLQPDAVTHNSLGLVYVQSGEDEKAAAEFRQAIQLRAGYADAHQNLGTVLITSNVAEAVRELQSALKLQPGLLKAQYNLALAYEASPGNGALKAIEQLRKLLAVEPSYPRGEFALGRLFLRQAKVEEAVEHLKRAVEQDPNSGEARYQLGLALSRAGRSEEGTAEIQKSRDLIKASENRQAAALDLVEAKAAIVNGDKETAIAKARKVLQFQPGSADAEAILKQAIPSTGPSVEAIERHIRAGRFQDAERLLNEFLAANPKSAWGWYALGYSLYGQRKIGESIKALAQSLQLDVNNAEAHKVLGRNLMIIGRFDAAKVEFERGKRLSPMSAEMPYNLGKLFSIQDNWAAARREFEAAVQLNPSYMEAYDGLGLAFEALGEDSTAVANYKKAIEMNETRHAAFASPYVNMSALCNRTGDRGLALDYARKALEANPQSDRALFQIAKANEYQGELNAAAEALNRAIAINGRASSYFYVLSTVYRKLGRAEESRKAMETFSKLDRESNELEQKRRELLKEYSEGIQ